MDQPTLFPLPDVPQEEPDGPLSSSLEMRLSWLPDGGGTLEWIAQTPDESRCRGIEVIPPETSPMGWESRVRVYLDAYVYPSIEPF